MVYSRSYLILFIMILTLTIIAGELRFCHNGPHRVKDNQCMGGILFNQKIKPKCLFHASDGEKRNVAPTYTKGICIGAGPDGTITSTAERGGVELQRIDMPRAPTAPKGDLTTSDCMEECLGDVVRQPLSEHFDDDLPVRNLTEETLISESLFDHLQEGEDDDARGTPALNIETIFRETLMIGQKHCGDPWVSSRFREKIQSVLHWIRTQYGLQNVIPDVNPHEFEAIMKILKECKTKNKQEFWIRGTHCANKARINTIIVQDKNKRTLEKGYKLLPKSYRWGKFEPFIEAAWLSIDFVRNYCFVNFLPLFNHLHLYQQYMETLFSEIVQRRWANSPQFRRSNHYWNILAHVQDLNVTLRNMDFCAQAALVYSPFEFQLDRPFSNPPNEDLSELSATGWSDTIESYWEDYNSRGGFEAAISPYGICAKSRKEASRFPDSIKVKCTPTVRSGAEEQDMGELPPIDR